MTDDKRHWLAESWLADSSTNNIAFAIERKAREEGFRRALKHAGYLPSSIDLAVERHRDWIEGKR